MIFLDKEKIATVSRLDKNRGILKRKPNLLLIYGKEIKKKTKNDIFFQKFIHQVELGIEDFLQDLNKKINCEIYFKNDFEIKDWEKIILNIEFLDDSIRFEEKLILWDSIDDFIRERIKKLVDSSKENQQTYFKNLNKMFFIEINPL